MDHRGPQYLPLRLNEYGEYINDWVKRSGYHHPLSIADPAMEGLVDKLVEEVNEVVTAQAILDQDNLEEELADVVIVAMGMANALRIDIEGAIVRKMRENERRLAARQGKQ